MHPETRRTIAWLALAALGLAACSDEDDLPAPEETPPPGATTPARTVATSHKANVRFKRDLRLREDFSRALALDHQELCTELGAYDCTDDVHKVSLGGTAPYDLGIHEPAKLTGANTPLVVERIALAACGERVDRDLASPASAVIFANLTIDADGALVDPESPAVASSIETLYRRALVRNPARDEVAHHKKLYADVAVRAPSQAARQWATLSCMVVLTSMESLFY